MSNKISYLMTAHKRALAYAVSGLFALTLIGCGDSGSNNNVAGGVTDIGNSVATTEIAGVVTNFDGAVVPSARVVAYYDAWDQTSAKDSVEAYSNDDGEFTLMVDSSQNLILFAEHGEDCGLSKVSQYSGNELKVGTRKRLESRIDGATSGYMRIVGMDQVAAIDSNGDFAFESVPPGEISLVYVEDDKPQARLDFKTVDDRHSIKLPPMEHRHDDKGFLTSPDFSNGMYGVDFDHPVEHHDSMSMIVGMEGGEFVFDNDSTPSWKVDYVEGLFGKAISLKPGQFISMGDMDVTAGDYTFALWTKWNGPNGEHQILFSQRSYWSDSTSKCQWHYDNEVGRFAMMKSSPKVPTAVYFGDSSLVPVGQWTFLAVVSRGGMVSMYVNGEPVAVYRDDGETVYSVEFIPNKLDKPVPFRIGGNEIKTETWNGLIDEVYIENYAQNDEWIKSIYTMMYRPPKDNGPEENWRPEERR